KLDEISTEDLVTYLVGLEHRDWSEMNRGKSITKAWVSRQLGKFGLTSESVGDRRLKGWRHSTFDDVFARYLPPLPGERPKRSDQALKPAHGAHFSQNENARSKSSERFENHEKFSNGGHLSGRAFLQGAHPIAADHRCDHCGRLGASGHWDWPGRPEGIWLHPPCEEAWYESEGRLS